MDPDQLHLHAVTGRPSLSRAMSQFHTPEDLAERMAAWAGVAATTRVLEPSAGSGVLARAAFRFMARVVAVELDQRWVDVMLADETMAGVDVSCHDFMALHPEQTGPFDLALMNPPYEHQNDARHIAHALRFAPRAVAVCPASVLFGKLKNKLLWGRHSLTGLVHLTRRPKFVGSGGKFDCVVVEVSREAGLPCTRVERWSEAY